MFIYEPCRAAATSLLTQRAENIRKKGEKIENGSRYREQHGHEEGSTTESILWIFTGADSKLAFGQPQIAPRGCGGTSVKYEKVAAAAVFGLYEKCWLLRAFWPTCDKWPKWLTVTPKKGDCFVMFLAQNSRPHRLLFYIFLWPLSKPNKRHCLGPIAYSSIIYLFIYQDIYLFLAANETESFAPQFRWQKFKMPIKIFSKSSKMIPWFALIVKQCLMPRNCLLQFKV